MSLDSIFNRKHLPLSHLPLQPIIRHFRLSIIPFLLSRIIFKQKTTPLKLSLSSFIFALKDSAAAEKKDKFLVFFWNSATFIFLLTATYHFV